MAIETLRPNAPGDETSISNQQPSTGSHWDKVCEVVADELDTYVYPWNLGAGNWQRDLYKLPASSGVGPINFIKVSFCCKYQVSSKAKASIKSNTTVTDGSAKTLTSSFVTYSEQWDNNPADGGMWEWADIDALQIGVSLEGSADSLSSLCTQVYVEVDYTPPAPLTITPLNYYQLGKCDALVDLEGTWTGNSAGTESDFFKEGIGCLGFTIRTIGQNDITYTKTSGTWNLSGVKHLRIWFLCSTPNAINVDDPAAPANAGIQFFVGDAAYTAYYKVSGKTSYPGGWYNLVVDLSRTPDSGTKPSGMLCTKVGIRMNMTAAPKNVDNVWIDNLIYCDGLACKGEIQFGFQDIYDKDNDPTGAWGVIRKIGGVYYLTGKIQIGVGSGSTSVDFKDTSQAIVFEDRKVNSALYGINAVGNSGITKMQLGDKSGTAGISGCTIRTQSLTQTPKFTIGASALGVNDIFKLYGCNFLDAGITTLPTDTANREVLNCNFEACGEVVVSTCIVKNCNFITSDVAAVLMSDPSHDINITKCNFISCTVGVRINVYGVGYSFDALMFSDTGWPHVNNDTGQALSIGKANQSNPSTWTGTEVTFTGSVILTMVVKDEAGDPIVGAWAFIDQDPPVYPWIMNMQTIAGGVASVSHTLGAVPGSIWRVRKYGYKNFKQIIDIGEANISLPITLVVDPQA